MTTPVRALLLLLLLVAAAGAIGLGVIVPYLERRWTYRIVKEMPDAPWQTPEGAEKVTFPAADRVRLRGWFFNAVPPSNGVTVLILPGNYGELPTYVSKIRYLQQRGFDLLLFNYRGFGMSDGETESEATLTRDAEAALHYLTAERGLDARNIAIAGISLGAPVAATLAARSRCRAVALISTVASARSQAESGIPWMPRIVLEYLGSPFNAAASIGKARCPAIVVHGAYDDVVSSDQARRVYEAAGPRKRLLLVPTEDHGLLNVPAESYLDDLATFVLEGR